MKAFNTRRFPLWKN